MKNKAIWEQWIEDGPEGPVVKSSGILVRKILEHLQLGFSERDLFTAYPKLSDEELRACRAFKIDQLELERKE